MSNDSNKQQLSEFEKEVEKEIEQARFELTSIVLEKQKDVVLRMGKALEKIRKDDRRAGICEELKHRLREEITRGLISTRTIEAYCKPEWKNAAKSRSGRKGAESKKRLLLQSSLSAADSAAAIGMLKEEKDNPDENREEEEDKETTIMVRTDGSAETAASNTNGVYWKRREQELIEHLKEKDSIILQQQQEMAGLEEEAQYYKQTAEQSVPVASEPREPLQHQGELPTKTILRYQDIEPSKRNLKFEFWLPFNALRIEMDRLYRKHGTAAKIWINGAVDIATGRVLRVNIGRSDNAARADEQE
jgi:hypothetical protein